MTTPPPWPADRVERRPLAALIPYARNARTHTPEQIEQLCNSIREWGWTIPVLIDPEGEIIAGHARVQAAAKLGFSEVPCMTAHGWSDAQKRAYVLADNQLALNAGWDEALLAEELAELQNLDFDLDALGFDPEALDTYLNQPATESGASGNEDQGIDYSEHFAVLVECRDEAHQARVFNDLKSQGHTCKVLVN